MCLELRPGMALPVILILNLTSLHPEAEIKLLILTHEYGLSNSTTNFFTHSVSKDELGARFGVQSQLQKRDIIFDSSY